MEVDKMIEEQGWKFNTNIDINKSYSQNLSLCDCAPCKNFRNLIKSQYPELMTFLEKFGIDIRKPEELAWWEGNAFTETVDYAVYYSVNGTAESNEHFEIDFGMFNIVVDSKEKSPINSKVDGTYFVLTVLNITLPWKEEESFSSVFVPKKKDGLLKRIFRRTK
jgi:hypothetical protein